MQNYVPPSSLTRNRHKIQKFLPSTYTITANSWLLPLISQLFLTLTILERAALFQPGYFGVDITSFCNLTCILQIIDKLYDNGSS